MQSFTISKAKQVLSYGNAGNGLLPMPGVYGMQYCFNAHVKNILNQFLPLSWKEREKINFFVRSIHDVHLDIYVNMTEY